MQDLQTEWTFYNRNGTVTSDETSTVYQCLDCNVLFSHSLDCPECSKSRREYSKNHRRVRVVEKNFPIAKMSTSTTVQNNKEQISKQYYVLFENRELYDPYITQFNYDKRNWKFRLVAENIFNLYLEYLGYGSPLNKHKYYVKTKAERSMNWSKR